MGAQASQRPWSRLQAAADDLFHDLGGAAEGRLDAAEQLELTIAPESGGLVLLAGHGPGSVWSARAAAFAWCGLGDDHVPRDRLAAWQVPGRGVVPTTTH
jgi:hypothetical protein